MMFLLKLLAIAAMLVGAMFAITYFERLVATPHQRELERKAREKLKGSPKGEAGQ